MLKGGVVLELRLAHARTTKDIDLRMLGNPNNVIFELQEAGRMVLSDYLILRKNRPTRTSSLAQSYTGLSCCERFSGPCPFTTARSMESHIVEMGIISKYSTLRDWVNDEQKQTRYGATGTTPNHNPHR